eukprot:NODE_2934_length_1009_cov_6.740625_g2451_i0.p1 GENE.NODE_2934_length_1009_cov_6.740625_g2451_i0~~NODE_2934_length_1009_cov_6.740625_g2451_i0.p1  ORF type:complete len:256 (+),score=60.36 NODE_2934_length_1009_cov_6.740625_g2451_i0:167-934(+)
MAWQGEYAGSPFLSSTAKRMSAFEDAVAKVEGYIRHIGTGKDNDKFRRNLVRDRAAAEKLCKDVSIELKDGKETVASGTPEQRKQYEQICLQYNQLLRQLQKAQSNIEAKEKSRKREKQRVAAEADSAEPDFDADEERFQQAKLRQYDVSSLQTEAAIQHEKLDDLLAIEGDLNELRACFVDFHALVGEQDQDIKEVNSNVVAAHNAVDKGTSEIKTAKQYAKSSRKKMCIIICLLLCIAAVIIIAVVVGVKIIS